MVKFRTDASGATWPPAGSQISNIASGTKDPGYWVYNLNYLFHYIRFVFISAAGITQVLDSIVWGWCASGNVFTQKVKSFSFNLPEPYFGLILAQGPCDLVHLNFYPAVSDVCRFVDWEVECCQRLYATLWARRVRLGVIKLVFSSLHYKRFDIYWTGTI